MEAAQKNDQWGLPPGVLGGRPIIKTKSSVDDDLRAANDAESNAVEEVSGAGLVANRGPRWNESGTHSSHSRASSSSRSRSSSSGSSGSSSSGTGDWGRRGTPDDGGEQWLACVSTPPHDNGNDHSQRNGPSHVVIATEVRRGSSSASGRSRRSSFSSSLREPSCRDPGGRGGQQRPEDEGKGEEGEKKGEEDRQQPPKQDYRYLAANYVALAPYRQLDGLHLCAMCWAKPCEHVFFPCQHKCACPDCIKEHDIGDCFTKDKWSSCPICCGSIKRIIRHTGHEVEDYWRWVLDVKPSLPPGFEYKFNKVGRDIRKKIGAPLPQDLEPESEEMLEEYASQCRMDFKMGYTFEETEDVVSRSCTCTIS